MSSTNKTVKLSLSQFLGTDKPAWLGDYNSDMQKIDDAFANLEQSGQSSAADIATLQQKDVELEQSITDVNDRVDTVSADLITVGNRTTVLEGNYDTMHHEFAILEEKQNDYLPLTGGTINGTVTNQKTGGVTINSYNITKGEKPSSMKFLQLRMQDSKNTNVNADCLSRIVYTAKTDGSNVTELINCKNETGSEEITKLQIGYNSSGVPYATAPTPANPNAKNTEIATTEWVWNLLTSLGLVTTP